jgi:glycosyltransferase involved in cell wall biosynthesis
VDLVVYPMGAEVSIPGCRVLRIPRMFGMREVPPGFSLRKIVYDAAMLLYVARLLWRRKYDVIHAVEESVFLAMVLGPIVHTPYVYDMDSSMAEQIADKYALPHWVQRLLGWAEGLGLRRAFGTIACCPALAEISRSYAPDHPVVVLEDLSLLNAGAAPYAESVRFPAGLTGRVIVYAGNLEPYQGIDLLLESFARAHTKVPDASLLIIGGAPEHVHQYRQRAALLGIAEATYLLGPQPVEHLDQFLARATVVVSPRIQGRNTPMKIYSYLDCGRPLLATRILTHTQVLDDAIACLVEPNPASMAAGMTRLLGDAQYCGQLAAAARQRVSQCYSRAAFRDKLVGFYRSITAEQPQAMEEPDESHAR